MTTSNVVPLALGPAHERELPVGPPGRAAVRRQVVEHEIGVVARRLPVGRVHRRDALSCAIGLVEVPRRHRPLQRHLRARRCTGCARRSRCTRATCWCRAPTGSSAGPAPAAAARRRTRGCGGSCRRRRSTGRPRSTPTASPRRRSARPPRATRSRAPTRRRAWRGRRPAPRCSSNTTVRSTPIRATSIDTGRPPADDRCSDTESPATADCGQQYPVTVSNDRLVATGETLGNRTTTAITPGRRRRPDRRRSRAASDRRGRTT